MSRGRAAGASLALAAVFAAVAFVAEGGARADRAGLTEALLIIAAGLVMAAAIYFGRGGRFYGGGAIAAFGAYVVILALSVTWSIAPDLSLQETSRGFAYLAVFAAAVCAARAWRPAPLIAVRGIAWAAVVICGWALVTRIFPAELAEVVVGARLGAPFDYWNALASVAIIGLFPLLWLGTRAEASRVARAATLPGIGVLLLTIVLTQSRGAVAGAAIALAIWLLAVPFRVRTIAIVAVAAAAVAPVAIWAVSQAPFTDTLQPLAARESIAGQFGALVALLVAGLFAAGLAMEWLAVKRPLSLNGRKRIGIVAVAAACVLPLAGIAAAAASNDNTFSAGVDDLASGRLSAPPKGAARLGSTSSSRGAYWREARAVFADERLHGDGAGAFEISRLRHRDDQSRVKRAHSFVFQTLADLGILGLLAAFATLAAWLFAASRTLSVRRPRAPGPGPGWPAERAALAALALAAVAFGLQSAIDWVWLIPAPAVMALAGAGVVAGHGPLPAFGTYGAKEPPNQPQLERGVWAVALLLTGLICAWVAWQPARADRAVNRSSDLLAEGDVAGALREADDARAIEPESLAALFARADVLEQARRRKETLATLKTAVEEHPRDPRTWTRLGLYEAEELKQITEPSKYVPIIRKLDPQGGAYAVLSGVIVKNIERQERARLERAAR